MDNPMHRFLFGPVNSRRLGRSLGVDLLPFKTCSLDCIYCECGWTTDKTLTRAELVPTANVIAELDDYLPTNPDVDYVTFSGSGEPTLHTGIGTIIKHLKQTYPQIKVAVLTNGTLLGDPAVQAALAKADLVAPSLDGATETAFQAICRPADGVTVAAVIDGIASFRRQFAGLLLLEIFIVPGINDSPDELAALKQAATFINPTAIQLNTLDRGAPHSEVTRPDEDALRAIRDGFEPLQIQTVRRRKKNEPVPWGDPIVFQDILKILAKGPTTFAHLSLTAGIREGDLAKTLVQMSSQALLRYENDGGDVRLLS
jgi:wyosine [tRNA(Phe)-imidazoG37] synthetase (radical SAM superfamily)